MIKYIVILLLSFNLNADYTSEENIKESNPNYQSTLYTQQAAGAVAKLVYTAIANPEELFDDEDDEDELNRDFRYLEEIDRGMREE